MTIGVESNEMNHVGELLCIGHRFRPKRAGKCVTEVHNYLRAYSLLGYVEKKIKHTKRT